MTHHELVAERDRLVAEIRADEWRAKWQQQKAEQVAATVAAIKAERAVEAIYAKRLHEARQATIGAGANPDAPAIAMMLAWVVDQSLADPPIRIIWVTGGSARQTFDDRGGVASARKWIGVLPIVDEITFATVTHELGHHRAPGGLRGRLIASEVSAWRWALQHSPYWTARMAEHLRWALGSYLKNATIRDLPDCQAADRLIGQSALLRKPLLHAIRAFEEQRYAKLWGEGHRCEKRLACRGDRATTRSPIGQHRCTACHEAEVVDRECDQLQQWRARLASR